MSDEDNRMAEFYKFDDSPMINHLNEMFKKQVVLQERLNNFPFRNSKQRQEFINTQSLALIDEIMEAIRETPWKPWKKSAVYNEENFKEELIDCWHFLINLSLASGMSSKEVYKRYINKNRVNHERQDNNY